MINPADVRSSKPTEFIMSFSASDSTGGAGLPADITTISCLGCQALPVITAITVQNTEGMDYIKPVPKELVLDQANCILKETNVSAFKIGVIASHENAGVIAKLIKKCRNIITVLDPILASQRGDSFVNENIMASFCGDLIPRSTLITPNYQEARKIVQFIKSVEDSPDATAETLLSLGCGYVLLTDVPKNTSQVINMLYSKRKLECSYAWRRLPGNYHGSGCTLAAAIVAFLSRKCTVPEATLKAQEYTQQALQTAFRQGKGQFIPNRFFELGAF